MRAMLALQTFWKKTRTFIFSFFLLLISHFAHAVVIDFDDLEYVPSDPEFDFFADHPITDEYLDQGITFSSSFLQPWRYSRDEYSISEPNYLLAGVYASIDFVGELPVFVGMYLTAVHEDMGFVHAFGPGGWEDLKTTPGAAGPESTPFEPRQYVSFHSESGISSISLSTFYFRRVTFAIDDINYEYSVPEPSPIWLLIVGLAGVFVIKKPRVS